MSQPLAGIRIIDLTHEWAGPYGGRMMADFGAEVIKVEYFRRIDSLRGGRRQNRQYDRQPRFLEANRNKRSITLDLHDKRDLAILKELARCSDVVVSNSRPGVLERLGIGYQTLKEIKTDIILVSLSACGQSGPEATYAGFGGMLEATSGVQFLTAYAKDGERRRIREVDVTNGIMGAAAIITALVRRQQTGQGVWIDLSQLEVPAHALAAEHLLEFASNGRSTLPVGNRHPERAPRGCYRCEGEDAWIVISIASEVEWAGLCEAVGHPEWRDDPRFATHKARRLHHDQLDELITTWTQRFSKTTAMGLLQRMGVPAGAVLNVSDLHADPHLHSRGYFRRPTHATGAPWHHGFPFRLSSGGGEVLSPGPALGEGNQDIICGLLARPASDVRNLAQEDIGTEFDIPGRTY